MSSQALLEKHGLDVDPSSYVDPNGFVFHHKGGIFRAIHPETAPFYRELFDDGTIDHLVENFSLVPSKIVELDIEQLRAGMVLEHERIEPPTYCVEWCPAMLRDASLLTVELAMELVDRKCTLQDAYPWNVMWRGAKPYFVDFTSIVEQHDKIIWPAYAQFQAFALRPLALSALGKGRIARALMLDNINGITLPEYYRHLPGSALRHPGTALEYHFDGLLQRRPDLKARLRKATVGGTTQVTAPIRKRFLNGLIKRLAQYKFHDGDDPWGSYYEEIPPGVDKDRKVTAIGEFLDGFKPDTVTDLGCNTGVFSVLAAQRGARVISIDSSENALSSLYSRAGRDNLEINPVLSDVLCPTPPFGFMGRQYKGLVERAQSDVVMCLGLMHHLHINGRQSFERIAALVSELSKKHLIFEFVGRDDDNVELLDTNRPIDYTIDTVIAALSQHFTKIESRESDRDTRRMLVCTK